MNKLLVVEDNKLIDSGDYTISLKNNASIKIKDNVILHDINNSNNSLDIEISNNSNLDFYQIKELDKDYYIKIKIYDNAKFNYYMLVQNENKHQIIIDVLMLGDDSFVNIDLRAINKENNSNLDIIVNGKVNKYTKNNELIENLKGLILFDNDSIKISPNMFIDTNEVLANHLVTIGSFSKEELFYLLMRGLSKEKAQELLKEAFIKHGMAKPELKFLNIGGDSDE